MIIFYVLVPSFLSLAFFDIFETFSLKKKKVNALISNLFLNVIS